MRHVDVGVLLEQALRKKSKGIPREVAVELMVSVRNVVARRYPGRVDTVEAIALFAMILSNVIGEFLMEIEPATPMVPQIDGRVMAVEKIIGEVLRANLEARVRQQTLAQRQSWGGK